MATANEAQFEHWEARAPDWLEAERTTEIVLSRFGVAAMERLAPRAGERVIDIGCGSGSTTLELARRVGPEGTALGVDIAPTMIAAAQARATTAGVTNVSFAVADAQVAPLGDGDFDAVFSRFGVMFFADPTAAFANIRRSLRADGRLAFACWQPIVVNEWMFVPGVAAAAVTGSAPAMPAPDDPGPFAFADPTRVEGILGAAGFTAIEITPNNDSVVVPEAELDLIVMVARGVGPVREALRTADAETAERIEAAVRTALTEKIEHGELHLTAGAFVVSARA